MGRAARCPARLSGDPRAARRHAAHAPARPGAVGALPAVVLDARDGYAPQRRGWGRYARELAEALRARDDLDLEVLEAGGCGPEVWWEQVSLPRRLRAARPDVVHATNCFLPLRRPCPGVVTVHDLAFEDHPEDFTPRTRWKYRALAPRAARSAERVICVSEFTRHDVVARWGVPEERTRVVGLAPSLDVGDAEPPPGPYLLAVGDLRAKKNLGRLVAAHARLRAEGLSHRLVLAGIDAGEGERLGAAEGVELTGWLSEERLDALMRGADVLVHPSLYEGFGLVLVEAMARGVPVACSRTTALPETAGDAGVLFDPLDVADIARAVGTALDDHERLAVAGRARVAGMSWARVAEQTTGVYREVAS